MKSMNSAIIEGVKYESRSGVPPPSGMATKGLVSMRHHDTPNSNLIPFGYCQCGCGERTPLYRRSDKSKGIARGEPRRFLSRGCINRWRGAQLAESRPPFPHPGFSGAMCVPLGNGDLALIDESDTHKIVGMSWHLTARGYVRSAFGGGTSLHRLIMDAPDGLVVDHINGNALDNRRSNLRLATQSENLRNRTPSDKRSLPKGVRKSGGRFFAQISHNHKCFYLGMYDTPEAAARAYDQKAMELHGEFARPNLIDEKEQH